MNSPEPERFKLRAATRLEHHYKSFTRRTKHGLERIVAPMPQQLADEQPAQIKQSAEDRQFDDEGGYADDETEHAEQEENDLQPDGNGDNPDNDGDDIAYEI